MKILAFPCRLFFHAVMFNGGVQWGLYLVPLMPRDASLSNSFTPACCSPVSYNFAVESLKTISKYK